MPTANCCQLLEALGDRHPAASTCHQLGRVAQEQRRFAQDEASYRQVLEIKLEFGDRRSAARAYHQLGTLAHAQDQFADAKASLPIYFAAIWRNFSNRPDVQRRRATLHMTTDQPLAK